MPCTRPNTGYWSTAFGDTGKRLITLKRSEAFSGVPMRLPCGKCPDCRLLYSAHWAVRGVHELRLHNANEFLTLTYADEHLPVEEGFPTLRLRHVQLFMKRLRKAYGAGVRVMYAGEYGTRFHRPHYHLILFNWTAEDKREYKQSEAGDMLYKSPEIVSRLWPYGENVIGSASFESIAYVARYITGKDEKPDWWYGPREVEFFNTSRRPGIGMRAFEKYHGEWYSSDSVIIDGRELRPPRAYDAKYELLEPEKYAIVKLNRRRKAMFAQRDDVKLLKSDAELLLDYRRRRLRVREVVKLKKAAMFGRKDM